MLAHALLLAALAPQYALRSGPAPGTGTLPAPPPAAPGFQSGADNCALPHTFAGAGDVLGVPFTTGTTGATGQDEALCFAFGGRGIDADVWFDWRATQSGTARLSTCTGTTVDTKVAVWPDHSPASCPPDGAALACNEDLCGLQSSLTWPVVAGATYTIQLGTFPGASGGSGSFDVTQQAPPPCGQLDDGSTESAYGLLAGGEIGWLQRFECLGEVTEVQTAYGTPLFPGSVTNGAAARVAVWEDLDGDGDPSTGTLLRSAVSTVVVNGDTDVLNAVPLGACLSLVGDLWVGATANHAPGEFPGPMDRNSPTPEAWVVGSSAGPGSLNLALLAANPLPPTRMSALGVPTAWLLRATPCPPPARATIALTAVTGARVAAVGNYAQLPDPHQPGRLFLDTLPGGSLAGAPDQQYVTVEVQVGPPGLVFADYEVRWELVDPDDPATHPDVDPNDLGPGGTPTGGDNRDPVPTESGVTRDFFAQASHPISSVLSPGSDPLDPDRVIGSAVTQLDGLGRSSVRLHYGDEPGDDYVLRAVCVALAGGTDEAEDETGRLTVWRFRRVRVDAMAKPADDVQLLSPGVFGGSPDALCVGPGANGRIDTYLAGDDRYVGGGYQGVAVGPNLVCETAANAGGTSYFPDLSLPDLTAALRASFASADPDRAVYLDPFVSFSSGSATWFPELEPALGKNPSSGEHVYPRAHTSQHLGGGDAHPTSAYHLIGVRAFEDVYEARVGNRRALARVDPHACVEVLRHYALFQAGGAALVELRHSVCRLLGHVAVRERDDDLATLHSAPPFGACCGDASPGQGLLWCPRHARRLRDDQSRAWPDHANAVADPREAEGDSE